MSRSFGDKQPALGDLMKKAQEMQKKMQEIQQQVKEMVMVGQAGGGLVKIPLNGEHLVKPPQRVKLDPSLLKEEISVIEDLIAAAINDASAKIETGTREKMSALTGIKLPDGFNLPTDTET
ncbi:MAG: ybaB [Gammaproteobacteria bacterium]|jgi:DNA-binding YbaB/EbfC family protein|nr:ybaB [Gammaproteobacteria bacterium]